MRYPVGFSGLVGACYSAVRIVSGLTYCQISLARAALRMISSQSGHLLVDERITWTMLEVDILTNSEGD